jgi:MoxR-like ATPase
MTAGTGATGGKKAVANLKGDKVAVELHEKFAQVEEEMENFFVEREEVIHGLTLAMLSESNILLLGPPGVAKSLSVRDWISHVVTGEGDSHAKYFEWLLTKFSTPEEIFGPFSIKALSEEDRFTRITVNKLPECHIAFLDEIFKCNSGLLNSLLPVLNERVFHNDGVAHDLPLLTVVGASNEIPDTDDGLEALFDRFLLKFMVKPIQEETNFKEMILSGKPESTVQITLQDIKDAVVEISKVEINEGMADVLLKLRRKLSHAGIFPTDRTYNVCTRILKAEAFLNGRISVAEDDFDVLRHVLWTDPKDERAVWTIILDEISPEKGKIVSLYEDACEVANATLNEKNSKKRVEKGIDTAAKLKEIKKKIGKHIDAMEKKGKDIKDVRKIDAQINALLGRVFTENCGIDAEL